MATCTVLPIARRVEDGLFSAPETIQELGINESLVTELFLKHSYKAGNCTITGIASSMRLPALLAEGIFRKLKAQQLVEVRGAFGDDFSFSLSVAGKTLAMDRLQISRYVGPVPVTLPHYERAVRAQVARTRLNRERLREAYEDLTLPPDLIERLGPALVAQKSMFLYGPSGTGKSSLAERVLRIHKDRIAIPWAVEMEGNIITVFDAAVHNPVGSQRADDDTRWIFCERPSIIVGGELVPGMLELQRDPEAGSLLAPMHMKANNGIFVVDDFGRQMISPRDLLNRWIVPLDRRLDYLTISGAKFPIPFEVFVVFSTNLNPEDLADEAFLRRIPNKILVDTLTPALFDEVLRKRLEAGAWVTDPGAAEHLRDVCLERGGGLRACYPRDILQIVQCIAEFEEKSPRLTIYDVNLAADLYYAKTQATSL